MKRLQRELFRNPRRGKIAGVCAGIADAFGFETWLVRVAAVTMILLSGGPLFFVLYIAAWFILDVKPGTEKIPKKQRKHRHHSSHGHEHRNERWAESEIDSQIKARFEAKPAEDRPVEVKEKVWQAGEPPRQAFQDIAGQFKELEKRLQNLETYVTSTEYTVSREIDRL